MVGFAIDSGRIAELQLGFDRTMECSSKELAAASLRLSAEAEDLAVSNFYIVTVPTPIDDANRPDLTALFRASQAVGRVLKRGDIVVFEGTVYPGATEEDCVPVMEEASCLKLGSDFGVGYSPERINPGDKVHRFETMKKVARIARECIRLLLSNGGAIGRQLTVTILGVTFKEDVPDVRNSKIVDITRELVTFSVGVQIYDPIASAAEVEHEYGLQLKQRNELAEGRHGDLCGPSTNGFLRRVGLWSEYFEPSRGKIVMDVKCALDRSARPEGVVLWRP